MKLTTIHWLAVCLLAFVAYTNPVHAQIPAPSVPDNGPTTVSPLGIPPGASADGTNESISYTNGSVNVFIPLLSLPQRGGYPFTLGYSHHSNAYSLHQNISISSTIDTSDGRAIPIDHIAYTDSMQVFDNLLEINLPRLRYSMEYVGDHGYTCPSGICLNVNMFCEANFIFTDSSGNGHPFENQTNCTSSHAGEHSPLANITDSSDGSLYRLDTTNVTDMKVISKEGTVYHFYGDSVYCPGMNINGGDCSMNNNQESWRDVRAGLIVDTNGNQIAISSSVNAQNQTVFSVTDTIGRLITISPTAIAYKDSNGISQTISITTTQSSETTSSSNGLSCLYSGPRQQLPYLNPTYTSYSTWGGPVSTSISIAFPAGNGGGSKTYNLQFDSERRVTTIQYPTGGYTTYGYSDTTPGAKQYGGVQNIGNVSCSYAMPEVVSKSECRSSSGTCSVLDVTNYDATLKSTSSGSGSPEGPYNTSMTVTRPMGDYETHSFADLNIFRTNPQETDVQYFDASGTLMRTVHKDYPSISNSGNGNLYDITMPSKVTTTLNDVSPAKSSYISYQYETYTSILGFPTASVPIDNPTSIIETDYDGSTKRTTTEQWAPVGTFSSNSHILDRPTSKTVTDGVSSLQTSTAYVYDNGSNTVGNLTKATVTATNATTAVTQYTRNSYGQVTQILDPRQNPTTISYDDTAGWANTTCKPPAGSSAYPTSVTNALNQTVSYTYNSCTGTIASVNGPNPGQTTTYAYDALQRVVFATFPDTGAKRACYFDSAPNQIADYSLQATTSILANCTTPTGTSVGNVAGSTIFDGLGRKQQSLLLSDPSGIVYTDTTYDADGHIYSVSNPYRTTSDPTYGTTTYRYDGLGRKTLQTNSDSSTEQWVYSGNAVIFTDESLNQWKRTSDALGRLTQVLEPNGTGQAPSMETDYTYDGFGNLDSVAQWGGTSSSRNRTFKYNGLSQLVQSLNPETGWICYGTTGGVAPNGSNCTPNYDADGNLLTKTDARNIVTTSVYDVLNRLTRRSYSDGTPVAVFGYDGNNESGVPLSSFGIATSNAIGRLSLTSNQLNNGQAFGYDLMGRLTTETYNTPAIPSWTTTVSALYDLAGNMTSLKYPDSRVIVQGFDDASRLNVVDYGSWNGMLMGTVGANGRIIPSRYLTVNAFDAASRPTSSLLGNGVTTTAGYNTREVITSLAYATAGAPLWARSMTWTPNGNLQSAADLVANTTRQYGYDTLNRLTSAQDIVGVATPNGQADGSGTTSTGGDLLQAPKALGSGGWSGNNATMASASVAAPDGSMTAASVVAYSGSTDTYVLDTVQNPGLYSGSTMSGSIWLRTTSSTALPTYLYIIATGDDANGNPGVYQIAKQISVSLTTSWAQFSLQATLPNGLTMVGLQIGGSGTVQGGTEIDIWGPQLQVTSAASSVTNLIPYSQQIGGAAWGPYCAASTSNSNMTLNTTAVIAPDGTNTSTGFVMPSSFSCGAAGTWGAIATIPGGLVQGQTYTASIWLKGAAGGETVAFGLNDCAWANVTLSTSWKRYSFTYSAISSGIANCATGSRGFQMADNSMPNVTYYAWGAQVEQASTPGQYVSTLSEPVTVTTGDSNILPNSQQAGSTGWSIFAGNYAANTVTAPDGTLTADTANSTGSNTYIRDYVSNPGQYDSSTVTASIYLAVPSGSRSVTILISALGSSGGQVVASLTANVTTTWQRFVLTGTTQNGLSSLFVNIGGGTQITAGNPLYLWGAQMVVGTSAGAYDPTTGTAGDPGGATPILVDKGMNETYAYDPFGNMTSSGNYGFSQAYDPTNRLQSYSYDASGNLLSDGLGNTYTYDAESRIRGVGAYTYVYGADGERVAKTGGTATDYISFGGRQIARLTAGQWTDLIYGVSGLLAEVPGTQTATPVYRMTDHLGSSVGSLSSTGTLLETQDYMPFGQLFNGTSTDPYKFTGKERDTESGLDYFGARYYASTMGRMMSPDWSAKAEPVPYAKLDNPQSLNLYAYVGNNPLSRTDPTGHYVISCGTGSKNCNQKELDRINAQIAKDQGSKNKRIAAAAGAYGKLNDKNGVTITVVDHADPKNANVTGVTKAEPGTPGFAYTPAGKATGVATAVLLQAGLDSGQLKDTVDHEGQHTLDRKNYVDGLINDPTGESIKGLNITGRMSEVNAYTTNGKSPGEIKQILSNPPYSTDPDIDKPLFGMPTSY